MRVEGVVVGWLVLPVAVTLAAGHALLTRGRLPNKAEKGACGAFHEDIRTSLPRCSEMLHGFIQSITVPCSGQVLQQELLHPKANSSWSDWSEPHFLLPLSKRLAGDCFGPRGSAR